MASRLNAVWGFMAHYKYLIVIVAGILIVGVFDENSFRTRIQYELQISDLRDQIRKYDDQYRTDSRKLRELRRNPESIEKIAREEYFMKANDEDIFVLSTDEPANQPDNSENETDE